MAATGFLPSTHGLHFPNAWPPGTPDVIIHTPLGDVPIGNAAAGLCGGFCFTARDLFDAGRTPPPDRTPPPAGSPMIEYLSLRLLASWNIPTGLFTYYTWATSPDADTLMGLVPGVGTRTVGELPGILRTLDTGRPCPLGLVTVHSTDPTMLSHCHQVLAYDYQRSGPTVTLSVYDPNAPDADDIRIVLDTSHPGRGVTIQHNVRIGGLPVRGFFRTPYTFEDPSSLTGPTAEARRPTAMAPKKATKSAPKKASKNVPKNASKTAAQKSTKTGPQKATRRATEKGA